MVEFDVSSLFNATNPVFSGGFGLAVLATGAQLLRLSGQMGIKLLRRHYLSTLEVTSKDRSYPWVLRWLAERGGNNQHLSVQTMQLRQDAAAGSKISFEFVPGPGQHFIMYRGSMVFVHRMREQQLDFNSGRPWEKVVFTYVGRNSRTGIFQSLLNDAYDLSALKEDNRTVIYTNWGAEWRQFGQPRAKRSIQSVILDEGVAARLQSDVEEWVRSSDWYRDRGIPYRRGYLLHGPPGSGKSSFIMALAGKLGFDICILNLSERGLTDDRLAQALSCVPPQSIVLLEDIDAAFPTNRTSTAAAPAAAGSIIIDGSSFSSASRSDVTLSGLLNVLDGVSASEERLVFMTTNHLDRLDSALIRPGRIDYMQLVDHASDYQIRTMVDRFYPAVDAESVERFLLEIRTHLSTISMATLQGHLLRHKDDCAGAIADVFRLSSDRRGVAAPSSSAGDASSTTRRERQHSSLPRTLTAQQVDRMVFNPQEGWDKDIVTLPTTLGK